jgi:hypothetical protein
MNFEQAFKDTFYLTPDQQHAVRETAPLPNHPVAREFFLLWLYWLHCHRLTLEIFSCVVSKLPVNPMRTARGLYKPNIATKVTPTATNIVMRLIKRLLSVPQPPLGCS